MGTAVSAWARLDVSGVSRASCGGIAGVVVAAMVETAAGATTERGATDEKQAVHGRTTGFCLPDLQVRPMKPTILSLAAALVAGFVVVVASEMFIAVDQAPALEWDATHQILRHKPYETGLRYPAGQPVRYTINAQGQNAVVDYQVTGRNIAVIGDSFVEALQVSPWDNVSERLYHYLNWDDDGHGGSTSKMAPATQVHGFGMSGAPLSEYLHMARVIIPQYHPALIIVVLVHNDFTESFDPPDVPLYESFQRVTLAHVGAADGGWNPVFFDVPPMPYVPRAGSRLMDSDWAILRLFVRGVRDMTTTWERLTHHWGDLPPVMGTNVTELEHHWPQTELVTGYLFRQFAELRDVTHTPILFVMDAPRTMVRLDSVQGQDLLDPYLSPVHILNALAVEAGKQSGFQVLDLTPVFMDDWLAHHQPFDFPADYHWNKYAHDLVAKTLVLEVRRVLR